MQIIGKNRSGIIVQILYRELTELNNGEHWNDEEMLFTEMWDNIKKNYKRYNDMIYQTGKMKQLIESIENINSLDNQQVNNTVNR